MRRAHITTACLMLVIGGAQARADDETVPLIDVTGAEAQRVLEVLQENLSAVNPDAILEWCPLVLRAVTDRLGASPARVGAACRLQDGLVQRRALLCADEPRHRFAWAVSADDDREALTRYIENACPDTD
jgi:hypothetical protein